MSGDRWWHCGWCGDHGPAEDPYVNGDKEPCTACGEGVSMVMTLKDAARLESAIAHAPLTAASIRRLKARLRPRSDRRNVTTASAIVDAWADGERARMRLEMRRR